MCSWRQEHFHSAAEGFRTENEEFHLSITANLYTPPAVECSEHLSVTVLHSTVLAARGLLVILLDLLHFKLSQPCRNLSSTISETSLKVYRMQTCQVYKKVNIE